MNSKNFIRIVLIATLLLLAGFASITIYIDPYFHYHKPLESLQYPINDQRYVNDGIVRHFDYNAIITGTSMSENFKTSEFNRLFDCISIKVPFSGGYYNEIDYNINTAINVNPDIKFVVRSLDYSMMYTEKNAIRYEADYYPRYLYNENYFDDANYILNKDILLKDAYVLYYTREGNITTSFDMYSNWRDYYTFGKETVLSSFVRKEKIDTLQQLSDDEIETIKDNIEQNIEKTAEENPDIEFYIFFTPYSICYWDELNQLGKVQYHVDTERLIIEQLLGHKNIKLYSFSNNFDLICNLDNYKDQAHYGEWVNSQILVWMKSGKYQLTYDNYENYLNELEDFYLNYDYDSIYTLD